MTITETKVVAREITVGDWVFPNPTPCNKVYRITEIETRGSRVRLGSDDRYCWANLGGFIRVLRPVAE